MKVSFSIPTSPHGKGRHRTTNTGRKYPDPDTANFEGIVKDFYSRATDHYFTDAVAIKLKFVFSVPASYSKKDRERIKNSEKFHTKKPDIDNLIKAIMDGLNGTAWKDDSQVICVLATKNFGERDYICVTIRDFKDDENETSEETVA